MYLIVFLVYLKIQMYHVPTWYILFSPKHQIQVYGTCSNNVPFLAKGQGGLLLGVGDGEKGFRYKISFFISEKLE
jgi:hypothetical protein